MTRHRRHDSLCLLEGECICDLLAKARSDEKAKARDAISKVWDKGYGPSLVELLDLLS